MTKYEGFHFRFGVLPLSNRHSPHFQLESESAATLIVAYFGFSFDKTGSRALCKELDDDLQSPPYFPKSPIPRQTQLQRTMLDTIKGPLGEPTIWGSIKRSFHDR